MLNIIYNEKNGNDNDGYVIVSTEFDFSVECMFKGHISVINVMILSHLDSSVLNKIYSAQENICIEDKNSIVFLSHDVG